MMWGKRRTKSPFALGEFLELRIYNTLIYIILAFHFRSLWAPPTSSDQECVNRENPPCKSANKSSESSIPTDSRISPSEIPSFSRSSRGTEA